MRILRWMCGVTPKDNIRNEHIRGSTRVTQASKKITRGRLSWYGHLLRKYDERHADESVENGYTRVNEDRTTENKMERRAIQRDMKSTGLRAGEETDRAMWRRKIIRHSGDPT